MNPGVACLTSVCEARCEGRLWLFRSCRQPDVVGMNPGQARPRKPGSSQPAPRSMTAWVPEVTARGSRRCIASAAATRYLVVTKGLAASP
jgi:hypothetical protein